MKINYRKILLSPWSALVTLALVLFIKFENPVFVESVKLRYFDQLITNRAPTQNNIYTVNIDEASLTKYGQWPLPRKEYARIIRDLYSRGAGLVVLNVLMAEPDRTGGDAALSSTMRQYPVILGSVPTAGLGKNTPRRPGLVVIGPDAVDIPTFPDIIANIPELENSAAGVGTVNTLEEVDGVTRRMPLVTLVQTKSGNFYFPSLSMEILRAAAGDTTQQVKTNENGIEKMRIPKFGPIATDSQGRVWIDWSQKSKSVSLMDLPRDFGGAVVIIGPTAAGVTQPIATANKGVWPHEVQAALVGTMFNQSTIQRPDWADGLELLVIAVAGIILLFLTRWTYVGLASAVIIVGGAIAGSIYCYTAYLQLFDITLLSVGLGLVALHAYGIKFVSEFLQKQQIKKQFGTYLSPAMVEKLQKNPELLQLGGDERELSIMFTDVRGFTSISEHYGKDVQGLTKIMNRYMTAMTEKIIENNGTLDKYIGDAQMAFWNAPLDEPAHAKMAVKTALEMMGSLDAFNAEITAEGVPAFGMGLGINTDTVVVGNMGSSQRFDYTCLGDGVNLASRLEGQSKPYGVKIVLGPKTAEYVKDEYAVFELDCIAVKGKTEGVHIYTLADETEQHRQFLDLYYAGDWKKALAKIPLCKNANPEMEKYYDAMAERLEEGRPDNWDGTYRATSK
jgi:adenylate cyclase